MFFEGAPRGIQRGRHDPLRAGEEVAQGRTVELFIFTVFKGFGPIGKILMVLVRSALLGDMHETHGFPLFLEVPKG